jgi:hypothetical protein
MKGWYSTGWITQNSDWPLSRLPGLNLQKRIDFPPYYHLQPILGLTKFECVGHATGDTHLRSASFWVLTQRVVVDSYRRFGTTDLSHRQGLRNPKRIYHYMLPNNPEERRSHKPEIKLIRSEFGTENFSFFLCKNCKFFSVHAWRRIGEIGL